MTSSYIHILQIVLTAVSCNSQGLQSHDQNMQLPQECGVPPDRGHCYAAIVRWFFHPSLGYCDSFIYGGCGGNRNNFPDRNTCMQVCDPRSGFNAKQNNGLPETTPLPSFPHGTEKKPWEGGDPIIHLPINTEARRPFNPTPSRSQPSSNIPVRISHEDALGRSPYQQGPPHGKVAGLPMTTTPPVAMTTRIEEHTTTGLFSVRGPTTVPPFPTGDVKKDDIKQEASQPISGNTMEDITDDMESDGVYDISDSMAIQNMSEEPVEAIEDEAFDGDINLDTSENMDEDFAMPEEEAFIDGDGDEEVEKKEYQDGVEEIGPEEEENNGWVIEDTEQDTEQDIEQDINDDNNDKEDTFVEENVAVRETQRESPNMERFTPTKHGERRQRISSPHSAGKRPIFRNPTKSKGKWRKPARREQSPRRFFIRSRSNFAAPWLIFSRQSGKPRTSRYPTSLDLPGMDSPWEPFVGGRYPQRQRWFNKRPQTLFGNWPFSGRIEGSLGGPSVGRQSPYRPTQRKQVQLGPVMQPKKPESRIPQDMVSQNEKEAQTQNPLLPALGAMSNTKVSRDNPERRKVLSFFQIFMTRPDFGIRYQSPNRDPNSPPHWYSPGHHLVLPWNKQPLLNPWYKDQTPMLKMNPVGGPIFLSGEPNYACLHPLDLGQCRFTPSSHPLMWFFNRQTGTCEVFYYAGCGGNANRFESEEECKATCIATSPAPPEPTTVPDTTPVPQEPETTPSVDNIQVEEQPQPPQKTEEETKDTSNTNIKEEPKDVEHIEVERLELGDDVEYSTVIAVMCLGGIALLLLVSISFMYFYRRFRKEKPKKDTIVEAVLRAHLYNEFPKIAYPTAAPSSTL